MHNSTSEPSLFEVADCDPNDVRLPDRIKKKFDVRDCGYITPCWVWNACTIKGYGASNIGKRYLPAHRATHEYLIGRVPSDLTIDHLCKVTRCVNPSHMEIVTQGENSRRARRGEIRKLKTHCKRGHELTPENSYKPPSADTRECRICANHRSMLAKRKKRELLNPSRARRNN